MDVRAFYARVYRAAGRGAPFRGDCGTLCDNACCRGDGETGMYLFPFEEELFPDSGGWYKILPTDFYYSQEKSARLFVCTQSCPRDRRPLACRVFPLAPYKKRGGELRIIVDPRARAMCPLAGLGVKDFDPGFVSPVRRAMNMLARLRAGREFIEAQSEMIF